MAALAAANAGLFIEAGRALKRLDNSLSSYFGGNRTNTTALRRLPNQPRRRRVASSFRGRQLRAISAPSASKSKASAAAALNLYRRRRTWQRDVNQAAAVLRNARRGKRYKRPFLKQAQRLINQSHQVSMARGFKRKAYRRRGHHARNKRRRNQGFTEYIKEGTTVTSVPRGIALGQGRPSKRAVMIQHFRITLDPAASSAAHFFVRADTYTGNLYDSDTNDGQGINWAWDTSVGGFGRSTHEAEYRYGVVAGFQARVQFLPKTHAPGSENPAHVGMTFAQEKALPTTSLPAEAEQSLAAYLASGYETRYAAMPMMPTQNNAVTLWSPHYSPYKYRQDIRGLKLKDVGDLRRDIVASTQPTQMPMLLHVWADDSDGGNAASLTCDVMLKYDVLFFARKL